MPITTQPCRPHPFTLLRQLQYAVAVADARSFRRAAEQCGVSQPSLSAQLAQLEGALGVRLFERDRRRVLLTPAGEDLVARARRVLVDADDLVGRRPPARAIRCRARCSIGVIPTISPYLLPSVAPAIHRAHPRLTAALAEDKTENLVARPARGPARRRAAGAGGRPRRTLMREVIVRDPFVLATPRAHPLAQHDAARRSCATCAARTVLLLDDGHCLRDQALAVCAGARTEELDVPRHVSLPTLAQMVSAGAGITLLPRMAVATESRRADIAVRPLADAHAFRTIALVWRPTSPLAPTLRALAATIKKSYTPG